MSERSGSSINDVKLIRSLLSSCDVKWIIKPPLRHSSAPWNYFGVPPYRQIIQKNMLNGAIFSIFFTFGVPPFDFVLVCPQALKGWETWASTDFFPGRAKFSRGGQKHNICLKSALKDTIFLKKSAKTYYFGQPGGGGQGPPLALPCGRPCWFNFMPHFNLPL